MTIAAAFAYRGGILLCSDTQQEGGTTKIHGAKIGVGKCPGGTLAFAFAGNTRFAKSAIQKSVVRARKTEPERTIEQLEVVLDREYNRAVYKHPDYGKNDAIPYQLLICYWERSSGKTSLFVTNDHIMQGCFERFQAIGFGFELANVLARPFMYDSMGEEECLILAAYVLARVKENVPGCGGESQFVAVRDNGEYEMVAGIKLDQIATVAAAYDKAAHSLLFSMVQDEGIFQESLDGFAGTSRATRTFWAHLRKTNPEAESGPLWTIGDPSRPPPSQG
jgi:hypothetical protein